MWKRLAPSRTKKLSTSWVMILRLTGKGKVAHCGLCFLMWIFYTLLSSRNSLRKFMGIEAYLSDILATYFKIEKKDLDDKPSYSITTNDFSQHFGYIVKPKNNQRLKLELQEDEEAKILQKDKEVKVFQLDNISLYKLDNIEKILPFLVFENFDFPDIYLSNTKTNGVKYYYPIIFRNCSINSIISMENNEILQPISFERCEIKNVQLNNSTFTSKLSFRSCQFEENTSFVNNTFQNNVYFNNSIFKGYADFGECEFEQRASFYGVSFEKVPNFSACCFKDKSLVNLVSLNIDKLDFAKVEKYINDKAFLEKEEFLQDDKRSALEQKVQLRYAQNVKDSFRAIKDILISQNNILGAQEWHKLELYSKEKEVEIRLEKNHKSSQDKSLIIKQSSEVNSLTLVIDKMILWLYRNTSFHHTCFTRILNFSVYMIFLYGIFLFILTFALSNISLGKVDVCLIFGKILIFLVFGVYIWYRMKKDNSVLKTILSIFSIVFLAVVSIFPMSIDSLPFFIYIILLVFTTRKYFDIVTTKINISYYFHFLPYIILLVIIVIKPQLLNPFIGIFSSNNLFESKFEQKLNDLNSSDILKLAQISQKDFNFQGKYKPSFAELNSAKITILTNKNKLTALTDEDLNKTKNVLGEALYGEILHAINYDNILNNAIKSTNILYSIILLLCIFSLQKTARKNSIIPS